MPGPVVIVDYDPQWPRTFVMLRDRVAPALEGVAAAIEHVGSTAVPGLAAKPIIDIDVLLARPDGLEEVIARLAPLNYRHRGDLGVPGRETFLQDPSLPVHHFYVCTPDCAEYRRHIAFRDWLRAHPKDAAAYGALKFQLAEQFRNDREAYGAAKSAFVEAILRQARS